MRLIDADALKNTMPIKTGGVITATIYPVAYSGKQVHKHIENAPTIEAEPVRHGQWVRDSWCPDNSYIAGGFWFNRCSLCYYVTSHYKTKYCPDCGAKMDLKENPNE